MVQVYLLFVAIETGPKKQEGVGQQKKTAQYRFLLGLNNRDQYQFLTDKQGFSA